MNDEERNKAKNSYTVAFRHCDGNDKVSEGLFQNSRQYSNEFREIEAQKLLRITREFYNDRLVDYKENKDGFVEIVLTKEGEKKALKFKIDEIKSKNPKMGRRVANCNL